VPPLALAGEEDHALAAAAAERRAARLVRRGRPPA